MRQNELRKMCVELVAVIKIIKTDQKFLPISRIIEARAGVLLSLSLTQTDSP